MDQGILSVKLSEMEKEYGRLQSRIQLFQDRDHKRLLEEIRRMEDEAAQETLLLEKRMRRAGFKPMYLWGLVMSGNMDRQRVEKLFPAMKGAAEKKGRTLEILFHPGQVQKEEITAEFSQKEAIEFHLSHGRQVEKEAVMELPF